MISGTLTCITRRPVGAGKDSHLRAGSSWCDEGILGQLSWIPYRSKYRFKPLNNDFDPVYTPDEDAFLLFEQYLQTKPTHDFVLLAKRIKYNRVAYLVDPTDISWCTKKDPWRFESTGEASYWARNNVLEQDWNELLLAKTQKIKLFYEPSS